MNDDNHFIDRTNATAYEEVDDTSATDVGEKDHNDLVDKIDVCMDKN